MFDKAKPYGTVSGMVVGFPGARYCQDGKYFNSAFEQIGGSYEWMHWKQLKRLVEARGHPWVDKVDAVAFLNGHTDGVR